MPAGLKKNDNMFSVREKPWHGMGVVLDSKPKGIEDAIEKAGLDWDVVQVPVEMQKLDSNERVAVPGQFVNVRSDDGTPLGIVSEKYRVLQNRDAFSFLSNLIGTDMEFETAGSLSGGKQVWVMATLPDYIEVGGDATKPYVFVGNSHDGYRAVTAATSMIRIVCQNTYTAAINGAKTKYSITHIGDPHGRLVEARNVLGLTVNYAKQFKAFGDKLASEKMTERQLKNVLEKLYPTSDPSLSDRKLENRKDAHAFIQHLFTEGKTVGNAPGTRWCGLNAITEFIDFGDKTDHDGKLVRAMTDPTGLKKKAVELVGALN